MPLFIITILKFVSSSYYNVKYYNTQHYLLKYIKLDIEAKLYWSKTLISKTPKIKKWCYIEMNPNFKHIKYILAWSKFRRSVVDFSPISIRARKAPPRMHDI